LFLGESLAALTVTSERRRKIQRRQRRREIVMWIIKAYSRCERKWGVAWKSPTAVSVPHREGVCFGHVFAAIAGL
jgi:hypothetical protein